MIVVDVLAALSRYFGHSGFRAGQEELVSTVLDGRDLLAVMPTGSGKSLGFQLPAVMLDGVTLVVSPLISLMKDQVDELNRRGIRASALHSQVSSEARQDALRLARLGELRLLYVAPERFASEYFARALREIPVSRETRWLVGGALAFAVLMSWRDAEALFEWSQLGRHVGQLL